MIAEAIHAAIVDEESDAAEVFDFLGVYEGEPAVFTGGLPDDAAFPAILINEVGGSDFGCRSNRGAALNVDVQIFSNKSRSSSLVRYLAKELWKLLNRLDLNPYLEGFTECGCVAEPPANTNDGFGFPGYTIRLRVTVLELAAA